MRSLVFLKANNFSSRTAGTQQGHVKTVRGIVPRSYEDNCYLNRQMKTAPSSTIALQCLTQLSAALYNLKLMAALLLGESWLSME